MENQDTLTKNRRIFRQSVESWEDSSDYQIHKMTRPDCKIVEPCLSESVYQIFLVTDFEVFAFAFAGEVEPVYCPCLSVHESS